MALPIHRTATVSFFGLDYADVRPESCSASKRQLGAGTVFPNALPVIDALVYGTCTLGQCQ